MKETWDDIKTATENIANKFNRDYGFSIENGGPTFCGKLVNAKRFAYIKNYMLNQQRVTYRICFQIDSGTKIITPKISKIQTILKYFNDIFNVIKSNYSIQDANKIIQKIKIGRYYSSKADSYFVNEQDNLIASIFPVQKGHVLRFMVLQDDKILPSSKAKMFIQSWLN